MRPANVEIVERFRQADVREFDELVDPEVEWVLPKQTLRGIEQVRDYYGPAGDDGDRFENLDVAEERGELDDVGDGHVVAINRYVYRWKDSGEIAYERRARLEYSIRNGKIVRYEARQLTPADSDG